MQKFARLLTLIIALSLAAGPFASTLAAPLPAQSAITAGETHIAMGGVDASTGGCKPCKGQPSAMEDCLPSCAVPGLVPPDTARRSLFAATYEPLLEQSASGAQSRPDPYPPRPIILS